MEADVKWRQYKECYFVDPYRIIGTTLSSRWRTVNYGNDGMPYAYAAENGYRAQYIFVLQNDTRHNRCIMVDVCQWRVCDLISNVLLLTTELRFWRVFDVYCTWQSVKWGMRRRPGLNGSFPELKQNAHRGCTLMGERRDSLGVAYRRPCCHRRERLANFFMEKNNRKTTQGNLFDHKNQA